MLEVMSSKEAAAYLRISEGMLRRLRMQGKSPVYSKPTPRKVIYMRADLDNWIKAGQTNEHTGVEA